MNQIIFLRRRHIIDKDSICQILRGNTCGFVLDHLQIITVRGLMGQQLWGLMGHQFT